MRVFRVFIIVLALASCAPPNAGVYMDEGFDFKQAGTSGTSGRDGFSFPTETPVEGLPQGYTLSMLTGLPILEEEVSSRPYAVVINNMYRALPQAGIADAEIIYEVLAEGEITRLVCVFQNAFSEREKIGPVRSARDYFLDFAHNHDAIFVHHGGSPSGYQRLRSLRSERLDGMELEGSAFWRDRAYPDWEGLSGQVRPLEHSSYTSGTKAAAAAEAKGFRTDWNEGYGFEFYEENEVPTHLATGTAELITVPFSRNYTRTFEYDGEEGQYRAYNRDGAHTDEEGAEVLVRNVIIQKVKTHVIAGDSEGRRAVETVGEGSGLHAFDGVYRLITWKKDDQYAPTRYFYLDGTEVRLCAGKTWVCVFQEYGEYAVE